MSTMTDTQGRRTRRSFTDDYKTGAVRLVLDEGKTVASAARDLGLTESSLRNWVEQARADRTKGKTGLTTAEREELGRLRKEVRELQLHRRPRDGGPASWTGNRRGHQRAPDQPFPGAPAIKRPRRPSESTRRAGLCLSAPRLGRATILGGYSQDRSTRCKERWGSRQGILRAKRVFEER